MINHVPKWTLDRLNGNLLDPRGQPMLHGDDRGTHACAWGYSPVVSRVVIIAFVISGIALGTSAFVRDGNLWLTGLQRTPRGRQTRRGGCVGTRRARAVQRRTALVPDR